jgi:uncharacterized membrane protein
MLLTIIGFVLLIYVIAKLRGTHHESQRQSKILYEMAVAEVLRPREGFIGEFKRGLEGK